jgi:deazaflavin-dependent oxidoreductase (nitroreductase family)
MPSELALKITNHVHRAVLKATAGRIGNRFLAMPVLELTTTGRQSGKPRAVMLTTPLQEGNTIVLVASRGGSDHHPAWFLNLRDDPQVQVSFQSGPRRTMTARIASAEERARMWPQITSKYRNYASYQDKTEREIPLVVLEPAEA